MKGKERDPGIVGLDLMLLTTMITIIKTRTISHTIASLNPVAMTAGNIADIIAHKVGKVGRASTVAMIPLKKDPLLISRIGTKMFKSICPK